jgi:hypothetical protein
MKMLDMLPKWRPFKVGCNGFLFASLLDDWRNPSKVAIRLCWDHDFHHDGPGRVLIVIENLAEVSQENLQVDQGSICTQACK